jgi:hypothetical protein
MIHDEATRALDRGREIFSANHNTRSAFNIDRTTAMMNKIKQGTPASLLSAQGMFTRDLQKIV